MSEHTYNNSQIKLIKLISIYALRLDCNNQHLIFYFELKGIFLNKKHKIMPGKDRQTN